MDIIKPSARLVVLRPIYLEVVPYLYYRLSRSHLKPEFRPTNIPQFVNSAKFSLYP